MTAFIKKNWFGLLSMTMSFGLLLYFASVSDGFSELYANAREMRMRWIIASLMCVFVYWAIDAYVLHMLVKMKYKKQSLGNSVKTAMIGLLYNALTPFAMGGQPMQVFELTQNNVKAGDAGSFITIKTIIYQLGMTLYAMVAALFSFTFFIHRIPKFSLFLFVGFILNVVFLSVVLMLCKSRKMTHSAVDFITRLAVKIRVVKNPDGLKERINKQVELFHESSLLINKEKKVQIVAFFATMVQLTAYYLVTYCIYRSFNLSSSILGYIICAQAIITMITAFVPLPGASGAAEGSFYIFFAMFFTKLTVIPAIFIWRIITYYLCILVGGLFSVSSMFNKSIKERV